MKHLKHFSSLVVFAVVTVIAIAGAHAQPLLAWDIHPARWSFATDVDPYGEAMAGMINTQRVSGGNDPLDFVFWDWTGRYPIGVTLSTAYSKEWIATHTDISAGGHVITGFVPHTDGRRSFFGGDAAYWQRGMGLRLVPFPYPTWSSTAAGVSWDGSIIVGTAQFLERAGPTRHFTRAYRWDRRTDRWTIVSIEPPNTPAILNLTAVSAGGGWKAAGNIWKLAGFGTSTGGVFEFPPPDPNRWPPHVDTGSRLIVEHGTFFPTFTNVGVLIDFSPSSLSYATFQLEGADTFPLGISPDGSVVVGWANPGGYPRAWRWTRSTDIQALPNPHPMRQTTQYYYRGTKAFACSWYGHEIVGTAQRNKKRGSYKEQRAVLWSGDTGWDLNELYESVVRDGTLEVATDISPDGRYIVGYGYHAPTRSTRAFYLRRW